MRCHLARSFIGLALIAVITSCGSGNGPRSDPAAGGLPDELRVVGVRHLGVPTGLVPPGEGVNPADPDAPSYNPDHPAMPPAIIDQCVATTLDVAGGVPPYRFRWLEVEPTLLWGISPLEDSTTLAGCAREAAAFEIEFEITDAVDGRLSFTCNWLVYDPVLPAPYDDPDLASAVELGKAIGEHAIVGGSPQFIDPYEVPHPSDSVPPIVPLADSETTLRWRGRTGFTLGTELPAGLDIFGNLVGCVGEANPQKEPPLVLQSADASSIPPAGDYHAFFVVTGAPIPRESEYSYYEFRFHFDADGDPANNSVPPPDLPNCWRQGTDTLYGASYYPGANLWLFIHVPPASASDVTGRAQQAGTDARIVFYDNVFMLIVPRSEFPVEHPRYRVTAFRHTGDFGTAPPHDWDGCVWPPLAEGLHDWQ